MSQVRILLGAPTFHLQRRFPVPRRAFTTREPAAFRHNSAPARTALQDHVRCPGDASFPTPGPRPPDTAAPLDDLPLPVRILAVHQIGQHAKVSTETSRGLGVLAIAPVAPRFALFVKRSRAHKPRRRPLPGLMHRMPVPAVRPRLWLDGCRRRFGISNCSGSRRRTPFGRTAIRSSSVGSSSARGGMSSTNASASQSSTVMERGSWPLSPGSFSRRATSVCPMRMPTSRNSWASCPWVHRRPCGSHAHANHQPGGRKAVARFSISGTPASVQQPSGVGLTPHTR